MVSIILTRLLLPEDFALIAMVMVVIGIANVFVDFSLGTALIQRKEVTQTQLSSIFWLNLALAIVMAAVVIIIAPYVANFYNQPDLVLLINVLSITFILNALSIVHAAQLTRAMNFRYMSIVGVVAAIISGGVGVYMAYSGYGVWSIVAQVLTSGVLRPIMLWFGTKWLPTAEFSWPAIKPLWDFSKRLFASGLIDTIFTKIDIFVIGKIFLPATLGYYQRAKALNQQVVTYSSMSLNAVLFPALSKIQDDIDLVRKKVKDFYHLAAMLSFFIGGLLYLLSEDIIVLMYTDRWIQVVPYFRILALAVFCYPVSAIILAPINSLGRSDIFLKVEVMKKSLLLVCYAIGFQYGMEGFLYAHVTAFVIATGINGYYSGQLIHWELKSQLRALLDYGLMTVAGVVGITLLLGDRFQDQYILHLIISSSLYSVYFVVLNKIFGTHGFNIAVSQAKNMINRLFKRE